ncbi:ribosomal RNA small subunit methyltransferase G [Clostridium sp. CAG:1219]|nr:ribosomal RNA small subunit methyltransferase G [Clostridium sp. CAG:1219]
MNNFKEVLKAEAFKMNIVLDDKMLEKFEMYKNLLVEWNEKINLTSITDDYEVIMKHFVDSLEIVKYINKNENIIDIGTGAGFPGIVIAIYFDSNVNITLLDALEKRLNFLSEVIQKLGLKKITLLHGRAEEIGNDIIYREKFDVATSRAVSSMNILLELSIPLVKVNGRCLLLKGSKAREEINASKTALKKLNSKINDDFTYEYKVNDEVYERHIIEVKKSQITNKKFPRNYGQIKKKPL